MQNSPDNGPSDPEENEWNSRLLQSKAVRQKIEDNVNALKNRISFLENEEVKLLSKIEETKNRALEVIKIKKDARIHSQRIVQHKQEEVVHVEMRKQDVSEMREELHQGLYDAYERNTNHQLSKAEEVKANLSTLKEHYKVMKKKERKENEEKCKDQRVFEATLAEKKAQILAQTVNAAKQRYENQISEENDRARRYENVIKSLETQETEMLKRLQQTQTQHQMYLEDFDKINSNQDPVGPLSSLRDSMKLPKPHKFVASPVPRVSPKKEISPLKKSQESRGKATNKTQHHLYPVSDFYR